MTGDSESSAEILQRFQDGRFSPVALLGRGTSGEVYRVADRELDAHVALKSFVAYDADQLYRIKNEFRALADLHHRNLVELYELFVVDRTAFFTMELIDGATFSTHVRGDTNAGAPLALTPTALARLVDGTYQLVLGLAALHAAGTLHRDVKPSNVLVTTAGRVVLLDFGLAVPLGPEGGRDTVSGVAGTWAYMAPELAWGRPAGAAADWYSVGVMLFEVLAGHLPFIGAPARLLQLKSEAPPSLRGEVAGIPRALDALVTRLLDPAPDRRPQHAEILHELDTWLAWAEDRQLTRPSRGASVPFVGRETELATLRAAVAGMGSGPRIVRLCGASGIGKTELINRFLAILGDEARTVLLRGRCHPHEAVQYKALDAVVDALSRFLMTLDTGTVNALAPRHLSALLRVFPVLARVPSLAPWAHDADAVDPSEARRRGFAALREFMARLGDQRRLIVWIDDLQWSDADSGALLREMVSPPDAPRLLLILSYRSEDRDNVAQLGIAAISGGRDADIDIELGPLDQSASRALMKELVGQLDDAQLDSMSSEAQGSPFFVAQIAQHVRSGGPQPPQAAESLTGILAQRLVRLSFAERQLLELVAVSGQPLSHDLAARAVGADEPERLLALHLEHEGWLRTTSVPRGNCIEVYHDRLREVIVNGLDASVKAALHQRLGSLLATLPEPNPVDIFYHLRTGGDFAHAWQWGVQAAQRAESALAFDRAAALYRELLEPPFAAPASERARLLPKASIAIGRTADFALAERLGQEAIAAFEVEGDTVAADSMRFELAGLFALHAKHAEALPYLEPVVERAESAGDILYGRALAAYAMALDLTGHGDRVRPIADQLLRLAARLRRIELRDEGIRVMRNWYANFTPDLDQARRLSRQLLGRVRRRADRWEAMIAAEQLGVFEFTVGRVRAALQVLDTALEAAVGTGTLAKIVDVRAFRALCFCALGRWEEVDREWDAAVAHGAVPGSLRIGQLYWARARTDLWLGRTMPEVPVARPMYAGTSQLQNTVVAVMARIAAERGDEGAMGMLTYGESLLRHDGAGVNWLMGGEALAAGWVEVDRAAEAAAWHTPLSPYASRLTLGFTALTLARIAALNRWWESSENGFRQAEGLARRAGLEPYLALTLHAHGRMLRARDGTSARAARLFTRAAHLCERLTMRVPLQQIEHDLAAL